MTFCLKNSLIVAGCLSAFAGASDAATFLKQNAVPPRVRSVVRADSRSGHLVRTVVVTPRVVQPVAVEDGTRRASDPLPAGAGVPEIVEATARQYDVDPLLVHSVIQAESSYNPYAVSPKGAQGLMQLMPGTARRFGVANSFDVRDNIEGGVRYLRHLQTLFPQDLRLVIAAYNAGEAAVWKYNNRIPPYRETEEYVYRVGKKYGEAKRSAERQAAATPAPVQRAEATAPASSEPTYTPLEYFVDTEGRVHLRTVSSGGLNTP